MSDGTHQPPGRKGARWDEVGLRFLDALDAGNLDAVGALWEQAAADPELERSLGELTDGLAVEEGPERTWEADAERVRALLRRTLPSAFPAEAEPGPLTVADVAARVQSDPALGGRLSAADREANARLLADRTPLPDDLGLPRFERWRAALGVEAGPHYWRAFRQAAVLLAMGRCQRAGELAAARQAGPPRGGKP
jgi:hypothetical protein